ncbi:CRISPR-associated endonuclease Cas1 [Merismopedia glauca]|uniref:CRISPR-associated endonuclease Cas1 n=1 Tax=Merismopedia glauca CCAP 1448/3 TaxID=1296344 RepID=A0A2T1C1G6_9CYAN|nr:CRISPR-associated endonuclease Cas1 [Merismopedia glauca]PSB02101.1 CRISPR-associated endonuclease Cas1 [Merismopedia glauca CCAP 1448/3]
MATIYLLEQGTCLQKEQLRFIIQISQNQKLEVPIREVERILVFGNIQLTTPAINACLQNNILVLFLNQIGHYNGHLWSLGGVHLNNEMIQIDRHKEPKFQFQVCQAIVWGKLTNSKRLLMRLNRRRKVSEIDRAILGIDLDLERLESVDSIDQLRGYEGIGAARYFPAFGQLITNENFRFSQRHRQPPTDPINSLLSFGYTILFNNVLSLIIAEGLSPYFGNFHYGERDKPYLAFDLMEEFRAPIVDGMVLKIINNSLLTPNDFETVASNGGVYLNHSSRRIFLKELEMRMNKMVSHSDVQSPVTYRQAIQLQIRRYKQSLLSSVPYESFLRTM